MNRKRPDYRDEDQRHFPVRDLDQQEAEEAKRKLSGQTPPKHEQEPGFYPSPAERRYALSRLSYEVSKAVDAANEKRKRHG